MLVQQLILITISAPILMIAVGLIHQAMNFGSRFQNSFNANVAIQSLAKQFRRDVQQTESVKFAGEQQVTLTLWDNRIVQYEVEQSEVRRSEFLESLQNRVATDRFQVGAERVPVFLGDETGVELRLKWINRAPGVSPGEATTDETPGLLVGESQREGIRTVSIRSVPLFLAKEGASDEVSN